MRRATGISVVVSAAVLAVGVAAVQAQQAPMTFFISSVGKGNGADLGGLDGADAHCNALARPPAPPYHLARLSEHDTAGRRRGRECPRPDRQGALAQRQGRDDRQGRRRPAFGQQQDRQGEWAEREGRRLSRQRRAGNVHDILTGSDPNGMYSTAGGDTTCGNWTKSGEGSAIVGHHDRIGLKKTTRHMSSWNSSHGSRGCSQDQLKASGGGGLIYCFVAN